MNKKQYTITETAEKTLRYIGETDGNAMELNCRRAVADYALNGTLPEDKEISSRIAAIRFEIDRQAEELFSRLVKQMAVREGVTEELKAQEQMVWVGRMNNIRNRATEIVNNELIYR